MPRRGTPGWLRPGGSALLLALGIGMCAEARDAPARPEHPPVRRLHLATQPNVRSVPLPSAGAARFDNDPLVFGIQGSKGQVDVGEHLELTVTVRYVSLSPTVRFLSEGATGYALKLLLPDGFVADENPLRDVARGWMSDARPVVTYVVRGRFVRVPREASFRLLRSHHDADAGSVFADKGRLTVVVGSADEQARALRVAAPTRQLIFNTADGERKPVYFAKEHHFTAVSFWEAWYKLNPAPGQYKWDSLRACLDLCRSLGLKAQVNFGMRRQRNTGGRPQDHEAFFPESDIMRFNDGAHCKFMPILDQYDVCPSFSSTAGMASVEAFMQEAGKFLKPYFDDGTLLNVLAITGQDGEFNYPVDAYSGNLRWSDYSQPTLQEYRNAFLPGRYGNIAALNQAWGSNHAGFADVPYPFGPTPNDQYPSLNSESRRDWIRFGITKIAEAGQRWRAALQSTSTIPFSYFASELTHYYYGIAFRSTHIPVIAATLDGLYTSAGSANGDLEASKLAWLDVVKGTLGSDKIVEIEFDNDDLSIQPNTFDQATALRDLGKRFFEKGGDFVHITQLGGFNWSAVDPYLKYLRDTYCTAPNNTVTARAPQASASYGWTKTLTDGPESPFAVWRSIGGPGQQVDLRCVDDFNLDAVAATPPPAPAPPAEVPCTRPAALRANSPLSLSGEVQLTASFDGGTDEPAVSYRWTRPDGTTITGQTYSFGALSSAPKGIYTFKATHANGAACLRVNLTADGISLLE